MNIFTPPSGKAKAVKSPRILILKNRIRKKRKKEISLLG